MAVTLEAVDYQAEDAAEKFVKSLHETGFGVLKNHPIAQDTVNSIYENWYDYFTTGDKYEFLRNPETQDGYFPPEESESAKGMEVRDIKEYYHYYPRGRCPEGLRSELDAYYKNTSKFAGELLSWVEKYSPDDVSKKYTQSLSSMIDGSEQTLLRVLHYPPLQGDEEAGAIRAGAHEDINLLTVLPAANEPGLQVKAKDGSWIDVPCDFGNLIVNIGDMLQEASGGYFPSTTHRVINPEGMDKTKSRISLPLFLHPYPEVVLSDRYTAEAYLLQRLKELGVI